MADDRTLRVGGAVTRPEKISGDPPQYTPMARRARLEGTVIMELIIDESGNVVHQEILRGLPMGLDRSALDAVAKWKYRPATFQGQPVKVYYTVEVNFHL